MDEALSIRWSRTIAKAAKLTTVTISRDAAGRYFASLLCDDAATPKPKAQGRVGIDLGLTHFAILSSGERSASPRTFRNCEARLGRRQRALARVPSSARRTGPS